jgi:hypothetical protein
MDALRIPPPVVSFSVDAEKWKMLVAHTFAAVVQRVCKRRVKTASSVCSFVKVDEGKRVG